MKKHILLFVAASLALAACSADKPDETKNEPTKEKVSVSSSEKESTIKDTATEPSEPTTPAEPVTTTEKEQSSTETSEKPTPVKETATEPTQSSTPSKQPTTTPTVPVTPTTPTEPTKTEETTQPTTSLSSQYGNRQWTYEENGYTYKASLLFKNDTSGTLNFSITEIASGDVVDSITNAAFTLNGNVGLYTYTAEQTADQFEGGQGQFKLANNTLEFSRYRFTAIFH